ncbi:hypothetical protein L211DRAFT_870083 [Terfezia boudieri ATCC MYA-4762]|uniref:Uncharacterized protein n=1 Tax=Terfezia boudieri ATCC MYA-4762 TaxID=1051890 RepID=A0A3N4LIE8_9PEZI|nr:hypothetical protein L211DRAFT_870083 [Terfezia boudieri ATCC MYA-4762]
MSGSISSGLSHSRPLQITVEWVLTQGWWAQDFYNVIDEVFPELGVDFGTPARQVINKITLLYHAYIERQPQGTHILAIDHPTERQLIQVDCLRGLFKREQRATIQAAVGGGNPDLLDILDMNAHWLRQDGSIRLLFPRTLVVGMVAPSPSTHPSVNFATAAENPYSADGQLPTATVIHQDRDYLVLDDTPPVSSTGGGEWDSAAGELLGAFYSQSMDNGSNKEESRTKDNEFGKDDAIGNVSGDYDLSIYSDNEASGAGSSSNSSGGKSDDPSGVVGSILSDQYDFGNGLQDQNTHLLSEGVGTAVRACAPPPGLDSRPGMTHGSPADDTSVEDCQEKTYKIREEHTGRGGDRNDPASGSSDSSNDETLSGNNSQAQDVAIVEDNNQHSESSADDEDIAGALPPDEIVPLRRHIGDNYDSDDEATEHHLFEDVYGHGPVSGSAASVPWAWWLTMCPRLLIQLCKFEQLLQNELLSMRTPITRGVALRTECRKRTNRALELMMWLGAVLLLVSNLMLDDHVDTDHQRIKFRMEKLTRQVLRGIWEAYSVVNSVRQAWKEKGSEVREGIERQLRRIHERCAQRREMLRKVTEAEVDFPQVGKLEFFCNEEEEEETEERVETVPVVADEREYRIKSAGSLAGTVVPTKWWKRGRRCSEGSYSLVE